MLLIDSTQTLPLLASPRITTPSLQPNSKQQMIINGKDSERFDNLFDAVKFVMEKKQCSNQEATHFVWDNQFRMGTDRGIWITL